MDTIFLHSIATVLAAAAFLSVCIWAYSGKRKADFDQAAQLPFADDQHSQHSHAGEARE